MARKRTMNRMDMRADFEESEEERPEGEEESGEDEEEEEGEGEEETEGEEEPEGEEDEEAEVVKPKKAPKKKAAPKAAKPRARATKQVRMKLVWGVFNNSNQQIETYPYPKEDEARAHAARLMADKKTTHFVQKVKLPMEVKESKEKEK